MAERELWDVYGRGLGELALKMGIEILEMSPEHAVATMPVAGNTQPLGIMHGGAFVVLGETLGSFAATAWAGPGRVAVGMEINASHTRPGVSGLVRGEATAIHLGRNTAVHEIAITNEEGKRLSTIRMTNFIMDAPADK